MVNYAQVPSKSDERLNQGDIIRSVTLVTRSSGVPDGIVEVDQLNVVVLSQNCEIDKAIKMDSTVLVACVSAINILNASDQDNLRKNKMFRLHYLPQEGPFQSKDV